MPALTALALACTLKPSPADSSSVLIGQQLLDVLAEHDVTGELVRVVDHGVRFGVSTDEGDGDGWPAIREKMLAADILVIATPIWMGQPSSVCKMTLERLDAELSGFTISAAGATYWVGEAMHTDDYTDQDQTPEKTAESTKTAARNAVHLAAQLKAATYPA